MGLPDPWGSLGSCNDNHYTLPNKQYSASTRQLLPGEGQPGIAQCQEQELGRGAPTAARPGEVAVMCSLQDRALTATVKEVSFALVQ